MRDKTQPQGKPAASAPPAAQRFPISRTRQEVWILTKSEKKPGVKSTLTSPGNAQFPASPYTHTSLCCRFPAVLRVDKRSETDPTARLVWSERTCTRPLIQSQNCVSPRRHATVAPATVSTPHRQENTAGSVLRVTWFLL